MPAGCMSRAIVLIGPPRAGKSTVGALLSDRLGIPQVKMDSVRFAYYREVGYDEAFAKQLYDTGGFWSLYRYWKPFEVHAVERVLADNQDAVIDFGAGHSVHEDAEAFERVRLALEPFPHVVLLLPSTDARESLRILKDRDPSFENCAPGLSELCISHDSNLRLAKFVVHTRCRTPEETCDEICALLGVSRSSGLPPRPGRHSSV